MNQGSLFGTSAALEEPVAKTGNIVPREYQQAAVNKILWAMKLDGNDLIVLPTGAGKSIVISMIARAIDREILILQPSKEILEQNMAKLAQYVEPDQIGVFSASMNRKDISKFTFATIQSIYTKPELFEHISLVLIDECHLVNQKNTGSMFASFLKAIGNPKVIGLTATPYRNVPGYHRSKDLYGFETLECKMTLKLINRMKPFFWNRLLFNVNNAELVEQGFLSSLKYEPRTIVKQQEIKLNKSESDFDLDDFENKTLSRNDQIVQTIKDCELTANSVLVFCSSIKQAEKLSSKIPHSEFVTGKTPAKERDAIISGFKNGRVKTVCNVGVLCLDAETEILTGRGFVGKDEFDLETDTVANFEEGRIWFSRGLGYVQRDRLPGERMVFLETKNRSVRVTEDHRMLWHKSQKSPRFEIIPAKDLVGKMGMLPISGFADPVPIELGAPPAAATARIKRRIAANAYNLRRKGMVPEEARAEAARRIEAREGLRYLNPEELPIPLCELLGIWMGDGSLFKKVGGGMGCTITQSKRYSNIVARIDHLFEQTDFDYAKYDKGDHFVWHMPRGTGFGEQERAGYFALEPYLDKSGGEFLAALNQEQFDAFVRGFWYADGEHGLAESVPEYLRIINTNYVLLSKIQAVAVCRGYRANIGTAKENADNAKWKKLYRLALSKRSKHILTKFKLEFEDGWSKEKVWCVTSESGNIVTRRRGSVTIMGNTTGFDHPALDCIVLLRPTRSLALMYQMLGRGVRKAPGKEFCRVIDFTDTVNNLGRVETIKLVKEEKWEVVTETGHWHNRMLYSYTKQLEPKEKVDESI